MMMQLSSQCCPHRRVENAELHKSLLLLITQKLLSGLALEEDTSCANAGRNLKNSIRKFNLVFKTKILSISCRHPFQSSQPLRVKKDTDVLVGSKKLLQILNLENSIVKKWSLMMNTYLEKRLNCKRPLDQLTSSGRTDIGPKMIEQRKDW